MQAAMDSEMFMSSMIVANFVTWDKVANGKVLAAGAETRVATVLFNVAMINSKTVFCNLMLGFWMRNLGKVRARP
jgi:hypothetical protein